MGKSSTCDYLFDENNQCSNSNQPEIVNLTNQFIERRW